MEVIAHRHAEQVGGGLNFCPIGVVGAAVSAAAAGSIAGGFGAALGAFAGAVGCAGTLGGPGDGAMSDESYRSYAFGA